MTDLRLDVNDEDFFGLLGRRGNLHEIFDADSEDGIENESLKYQSPQPKTEDASVSAGTAADWRTCKAWVVEAFKADELFGRIGIALLANAKKSVKLCLYKSKEQVFGTLTMLAPEQRIKLRKKSNFIQFHDDMQCYWSVRFNEADEKELEAQLIEYGIQVSEDVDLEKINLIDESGVTPDFQPQEKSHNADIADLSTDDELNNESHSKIAIVSRIAKMGQPLPILKADTVRAVSNLQSTVTTSVANDNSDVSTDTVGADGAAGGDETADANKFADEAADMDDATVTNSSYENSFLDIFSNENGYPNVDSSVSLAKLHAKVNKILDCVQKAPTVAKKSDDAEDEILQLSEKNLELRRENRKLKLALAAISDGNVVKANIIQIQKMYGDELSNVGVVVKEDENIETVFEALVNRTTALHRGLVKRNSDLIECRKLYQTMKEANELNSEQLTELKITNKVMQSRLDESENAIKVLREKLAQQINALTVNTKKIKADCNADMKIIMNNVYRKIAAQIESLPDIDKAKALSIIGTTIREETFLSLEKKKPPKPFFTY